MGGESLTSLYEARDYIDRDLRAHRTLAAKLENALASDATVKLEEVFGSFDLWVYAVDRACQLASLADGTIGCALLIHATQVMRIEVASEAEAIDLVEGWVGGRTIAEIRAAHVDAEVAAHAELFEAGDVAGWLWASLLHDSSAGSGVLRIYRSLIVEILERPVASFFCVHEPQPTLLLPLLPLSVRDPRHADGRPRSE